MMNIHGFLVGRRQMMPTNKGSFELFTQSKENVTEHPYNLQRALERFECGYLNNILVLTDGDLAYAAEMLGISPKTLSRKIKRYELFSVCHM
jgi:DNA-binding NtrC family response regulator